MSDPHRSDTPSPSLDTRSLRATCEFLEKLAPAVDEQARSYVEGWSSHLRDALTDGIDLDDRRASIFCARRLARIAASVIPVSFYDEDLRIDHQDIDIARTITESASHVRLVSSTDRPTTVVKPPVLQLMKAAET
jgi:hypothetical protein